MRIGETANRVKTNTYLYGWGQVARRKQCGSLTRHGWEWEEDGTPEPLGGGGGNPCVEEAGGGGSTEGDGRIDQGNDVAAPGE